MILRMNQQAQREIKLNSLRCILIILFSVVVVSCNSVKLTTYNDYGDKIKVQCSIKLGGKDVSIRVKNKNKQSLYIDDRFIKLIICATDSIKIKPDGCLSYGKKILDPTIVKSEFIKLKTYESYEVTYSILPYLNRAVSLDIEIPFFLNDSIISTVKNDKINTSQFLSANKLTLRWDGQVEGKTYNISDYAAILPSSKGW